MNTKKAEALLLSQSLLSSLTAQNTALICRNTEYLSFKAGEWLYPLPEANAYLYFLLSGTALVYSGSKCIVHASKENSDENEHALLNILTPGCIFGVSSLFQPPKPPEAVSCIVAKSAGVLARVSHTVFESVLLAQPEMMIRYVQFLTTRTVYLNEKIRYLTGGSAERKLAIYLLHLSGETEKAVILPVPANTLSALLDISRASLYRAFDTLTKLGFLYREGDTVQLSQLDNLRKTYHL